MRLAAMEAQWEMVTDTVTELRICKLPVSCIVGRGEGASHIGKASPKSCRFFFAIDETCDFQERLLWT